MIVWWTSVGVEQIVVLTKVCVRMFEWSDRLLWEKKLNLIGFEKEVSDNDSETGEALFNKNNTMGLSQ